MQHGAALSEGRPSGSLRRDLAVLPLLRRLPPVCAGALLRGGAEAGSLPQAALLPAGSGHGPDREVEGRCAYESRDTKLKLSGGRVKARYQRDCHFRLGKNTSKSVSLVVHENNIFLKNPTMEEMKSVTCVSHMLHISCQTSSVSVGASSFYVKKNYINIDGPGHIIFETFFSH